MIGSIRIQPAPLGGCRIERFGYPAGGSEPLWFCPRWASMGLASLDATFQNYDAALAALKLTWPCKTAPRGFEAEWAS